MVAQLVDRSIPTLEVRSSNPVIRRTWCDVYVFPGNCRKDENKEKEAGNGAL